MALRKRERKKVWGKRKKKICQAYFPEKINREFILKRFSFNILKGYLRKKEKRKRKRKWKNNKTRNRAKV